MDKDNLYYLISIEDSLDRLQTTYYFPRIVSIQVGSVQREAEIQLGELIEFLIFNFFIVFVQGITDRQ